MSAVSDPRAARARNGRPGDSERRAEHGPSEDPQVNLKHETDDGTLLDRWRERRDGDAFAELARRHSPVVFDLTCRVLGDRAGAEDVLQEALLSLALEETRKPAEVGVVAWLARFAICRARNRRASERCRTRRQIKVGLERPEGAMPDDSLELREELESALSGCDPEDRALLAMRYLHGWDYDRIAAALSIREGAARVRVHRALEAVRARSASRAGDRPSPATIAPLLAAVPVARMTDASLDASIRSVVEIAKVRLGATPNGVEHATAASRAFRVAVATAGAALLAAAATEIALPGTLTSAVASAEDTTAAVRFDVADAGRAASAPFVAAAPAPADLRFAGIPRPEDWDAGFVRALARGGSVGDAGAAAEAVAAERDPVPQVAPDIGRRADAADDAVSFVEDVSPSALRPSSRAVCAAKGGTVSSDGERAGALGGTSISVADESVAADDEQDAETDDVPAPGVGGVPATADALPEATRALLGEAESLVRRLLEEQVGADVLADAAVARRTVRREFGRIRGGGGAVASRGAAQRAKRSRAVLRRVLGLLTQQVLATGSDVRWPSGADLDAALLEVIRVLGATSGTRLPSGAAGAAVPPSGAASDRTLPSGAVR